MVQERKITNQKDIELIRMLKGKNMDDTSIATAMNMEVEDVQNAILDIYSHIDPAMEILFAVDTYKAMIGDLSFLSMQIQEKYKNPEGKTTDPISKEDIKLVMELNSKISKLHVDRIKLLESIKDMKYSRKQTGIDTFYNIPPLSTPTPKIKRKINPDDLYEYIYKTLNWLMLEHKNHKQFKIKIKKGKYYMKLFNISKSPDKKTFDDVILCIKMNKIPKPLGTTEKHLYNYWNELT